MKQLNIINTIIIMNSLNKMDEKKKSLSSPPEGEKLEITLFWIFGHFGEEKTRKMTLFDLPARQAYLGPTVPTPFFLMHTQLKAFICKC